MSRRNIIIIIIIRRRRGIQVLMIRRRSSIRRCRGGAIGSRRRDHTPPNPGTPIIHRRIQTPCRIDHGYPIVIFVVVVVIRMSRTWNFEIIFLFQFRQPTGVSCHSFLSLSTSGFNFGLIDMTQSSSGRGR